MITGFWLALTLAPVVSTAVPAPPLYTPASCADPAARKAMLAAGPDQAPALKALKAHAATNEQRMTLLLARLAERGKLSAAQADDAKAAIMKRLFANRQFVTAFAKGAGIIERLMDGVMRMTGKDDEASCRIAMETFTEAPAILAIGEQQWAGMRAEIDAEAKRLGVSLAD